MTTESKIKDILDDLKSNPRFAGASQETLVAVADSAVKLDVLPLHIDFHHN